MCLRQALTHVPMTCRLEGVTWGFLVSEPRAGVKGIDDQSLCNSQVSPLHELASLSLTRAGRLLWLRATAGPAELKIAV